VRNKKGPFGGRGLSAHETIVYTLSEAASIISMAIIIAPPIFVFVMCVEASIA